MRSWELPTALQEVIRSAYERARTPYSTTHPILQCADYLRTMDHTEKACYHCRPLCGSSRQHGGRPRPSILQLYLPIPYALSQARDCIDRQLRAEAPRFLVDAYSVVSSSLPSRAIYLERKVRGGQIPLDFDHVAPLECRCSGHSDSTTLPCCQETVQKYSHGINIPAPLLPFQQLLVQYISYPSFFQLLY